MSLKFTTLFHAREWFDITVPDWFKERVETLTKTLGEDNEELTVFKDILSGGKLTEELIQNTHVLASSTQQGDIFLLAVDIAQHACTAIQTIALVVPVNIPTNA
ncbi:MAG: hypothetical protein CTY24_04220 [Methylobacter sp.]|nr:MAG: hypothetical protein CTY24_04220 [Methylobacter sp.]